MTHRVHRAGGDRRDRPAAGGAFAPHRTRPTGVPAPTDGGTRAVPGTRALPSGGTRPLPGTGIPAVPVGGTRPLPSGGTSLVPTAPHRSAGRPSTPRGSRSTP
ncbi:hypothetical protein D7I43_02585 [Micromonospora globbae]|uniref:Uncharacterized protein n=1 Tax=Micromonospora globbae TaxID=1894969 RepID=A0A420F6V3_9ACTN|nr:hypothetical protein D7I43_02585 [Micromonospora globbae]